MNSLNKKTIEDIDVSGKRVLVRCDFNVPLKDGVITNDKRIVAALPTIQYLIDHQAKVILCSHLGRPKGEYKEEFSLAPVAARLSELLHKEVKLAADKEVVGENAKAMAAAMQPGDVILLENVRFRKEETKNRAPRPLLHHRRRFLPAGRLRLSDSEGNLGHGSGAQRSKTSAGCHPGRREGLG